MHRPVGVTIIALIFSLAAILFLGTLMIAVLGPELISAFHNPNFRQDIQNAGTYRGAHMLLFLIFAAIAFGLWRLQRWARWAVLLLTGVGLARGIIILLLYAMLDDKFENSLDNFFWFQISLNSAIFLYLRFSPGRAAFTRSGLS